MKPEPCDQYRECIEQYSCGELKSGENEILLEHIQQCTACRAYLDALNDQEQKMAQWAESLEPLIETGQAQAVDRFRLMPEQTCRTAGVAFNRWRLAGYAAAACIFIAAGFLAGRGLQPSLDIDQLQQQWAATVQPQMEDRITASVVRSLQPEIVEEYGKLQDALSDQINLELKVYAEQTVTHNDTRIYQLLTGLIDAIETAQVQNQQWTLSAMAELENQQLRDKEEVYNQFATFAVYTGNELLRTQQKLEALSAKQKN
ncbi:MAG: anti-sigma factor [Planctomycetota bacterium]|jgi:hypothetical protein